MPPKFKFTKEEIIDACFYLTKTEGLKAVTARGVAARLNSSSKVIFSLFKDMDDVKRAVVERVKGYYKTFVDEGLKDALPFKGVGNAYIRFAREEPKLFQLLFMQESKEKESFECAIKIDESYERILEAVQTSYGLDEARAKELYNCLWVATHGIAVLVATKVCNFTDEDIQSVLSKIIKGVLHEVKK